MTPSSLGTITAIFTTSWDPSTRCSRIGLRVSGLGWISAAIRGGGAPGAPLPNARWDGVEETARPEARAETRTLVRPDGTAGTRDHSLAAASRNHSAPGSEPRNRQPAQQPSAATSAGGGSWGRSREGAGPAAGCGRRPGPGWTVHFRRAWRRTRRGGNLKGGGALAPNARASARSLTSARPPRPSAIPKPSPHISPGRMRLLFSEVSPEPRRRPHPACSPLPF